MDAKTACFPNKGKCGALTSKNNSVSERDSVDALPWAYRVWVSFPGHPEAPRLRFASIGTVSLKSGPPCVSALLGCPSWLYWGQGWEQGMGPAQLCSERPEAQGSAPAGSSGWREKAEDYPQKSLETNEVGWSKHENSCEVGLPHTRLQTSCCNSFSGKCAWSVTCAPRHDTKGNVVMTILPSTRDQHMVWRLLALSCVSRGFFLGKSNTTGLWSKAPWRGWQRHVHHMLLAWQAHRDFCLRHYQVIKKLNT